ncbi:unnamed protein product, partial [Sphagnum troendelagicum]
MMLLMLLMILLMLLSFEHFVRLDFCVADFSPNAPRVNGYPCKARANVTSKDFLFTGFRKA